MFWYHQLWSGGTHKASSGRELAKDPPHPLVSQELASHKFDQIIEREGWENWLDVFFWTISSHRLYSHEGSRTIQYYTGLRVTSCNYGETCCIFGRMQWAREYWLHCNGYLIAALMTGLFTMPCIVTIVQVLRRSFLPARKASIETEG